MHSGIGVDNLAVLCILHSSLFKKYIAMKLIDYAPIASRKILVYGAPKTGKTDLVGGLAEKYKLWWFDLEDGIKTLLSSPRIKKEWLNNIELFSIPDTQTHPRAIDVMLRVIKGGPNEICHDHGVSGCPVCKKSNPTAFSSIDVRELGPNDVVVIDSVSQLAASAMNYIQKDIIAKDNFDKKPEWDDYAKQGRIMDRIYSIIQQAPFHCVSISHEQLVEQEDGKKKLVPIGGTSQFSKTFAKYFDDVVYCEIVNKKHKAASSTTYSNSIVLGSRTGKQLENQEIPSLLELFK